MVPSLDPSFWTQPIDQVLYTVLVQFGWIPIALTIVHGLLQVWKNHKQGEFLSKQKYVMLAIDVPAMTEQTPKSMENLFAMLASSYSGPTFKEEWIIGKVQTTFSFEIVSTDGYVQFLVRLQPKFRDALEAAIYAHYPDAEIAEVEDYARDFPTKFPNDTHDMWGSEFKLKNPEIFPIRTIRDFEDPITKEIKDPLGQILEQMAKMRPGENFWVQYLLEPCNNDWQKAGGTFINKVYGIEKPPTESGFTAGLRTLVSVPDAVLAKTLGITIGDLFLGAPPKAKEADQWRAFKLTSVEKEQTAEVLEKISKPGFKVKVRVLYVARKEAFNKGGRVLMIKGMFNQYANSYLNSFGFFGQSMPKDDYFWQVWEYAKKQETLMKAYVNRDPSTGANGLVLNSEELATLWHFPMIGVKAPMIRKAEARRAEPPIGLPVGLDEPLPTGPRADKKPKEEKAYVASAPDVSLPGMAAAAYTSSPVRATAPHAEVAAEPEEVELGLDATDMGPPADVELPGPPPGFVTGEGLEDKDNDGSREGAPPPNLPM